MFSFLPILATIGFTGSFPNYYTENGPPASSYLADGLTVYNGQFFLDTLNEDLYICYDDSDQNALVWRVIPRSDQVSAYLSNSGVSAGFYTTANITVDPTGRIISASNGNPSFSPAVASRSLNSVFQIHASRAALVSYSVDILCTATLVSGQTGTVFLEYADDSGFTSNVVEICRFVNGNSVSLAIALTAVQDITGVLSGFVPAGKYVRIRTANTLSTPTFTYRSGQEVLL